MHIIRTGYLLVFLSLLISVHLSAADLMLPHVYNDQTDVSGWLMSEKLDGIRGYWNGTQLLSKNGNQLYPPTEFIAGLPNFPLEGELWGGRGTFEQTASVVKTQKPHDGWLLLKFAIFDVPQASGGFTSRIAAAKSWFNAHPSPYAFVIPQIQAMNQEHLQKELHRIETLGGEGLIVRNPNALYRAGRSAEILKVKNYQDAEARVVAQLPGKGRNKGRLGALLVQLDDGIQFRIGSGFSDSERKSPPAIGTFVTFKFYGRYESGIPKFPSFLRIRHDSDL